MAKENKRLATISKYQKVFSSPEGQDVLRDMMATHGITSSIFGSSDREMLLKEGERNVVLRIFTILKLNVNDIKQRMEQAHEE